MLLVSDVGTYIYFAVDDFDSTEEKLVYGTEQNSTFLECIPKSPQATVQWFVHRSPEKLKDEVRQVAFSIILIQLFPFHRDGFFFFCSPKKNLPIYNPQSLNLVTETKGASR